MKILVISNLYPASPQIKDQTGVMLLHQYAKCWSQSHAVTVINPHSYNMLEVFKIRGQKKIRQFQLDGITVFNELILRLPGDNLQVQKIEKLFRELKSFDMIIGCLPVGLEIAHFIGKKFSIPYFAYLHNTDFHRSGVSKGRITNKYHRFLSNAMGLTFVSPKLKDAFKDYISHSDSFILPGAIAKFWVEDQPERKLSEMRLITSGKLVRQKNIDSILFALGKLNGIKFTLDIVGDGECRPDLEEIVSDRPNLGVSVSFKGMVDHAQMRYLFDQNDFMILLSTNESFGLVYIEAMARGCIPIGTRGEGIDGVIRHKHNGFLCRSDQESIKQLLIEISSYPNDELMKISLEAMKTAKEYMFEDLANSFIEFTLTKLNRV